MRNKIIFFLVFFLFASFSVLHAESKPRFVYRIGVLSASPVNEARSQWVPLGYYLRDRVPDADFAVVPMNFNELEKAISANDLDFVLTNPAQYVDWNERFGVECIATLEVNDGVGSSSLYGGAVFVKLSNEDIHSWGDLKGKRFVAVNEIDFGGWLSVWREFKKGRINPFRDFRSLRFLGDQERVVDTVLSGEADAGSVQTGTLEKMASEGKIRIEDIRVIYNKVAHGLNEDKGNVLHSTRFYPQWPLARTRRVNEGLAKQVTIALLQMESDDLAAVAGGYAGWTIPSSYTDVSKCLQEIGFGPFRNYGKMNEGQFLQIYKWRILTVCALFLLALAFAFYVGHLNRRLLRSTRKLEEELKVKSKMEADLRRNDMALRNMVMDLAETHGSLQSVRDQLLQSEKMAAIGQLAAGVAHELNNPLGFISNNIGILQEYWDKLQEIFELYAGLSRALEVGTPDSVDKALHAIDVKAAQYDMDYLMEDAKNIYIESLQGVERMQRIINDLKTFAREDRAVRSHEDICQIMDSILGIVHNEMKYKATLIKEYASVLPLVPCNKQQIGQVFINILLNAVQSIEKRGEIRIRVYQDEDGGMVKVDIEDTGFGIPEQNLNKVFEPFFSTKDVGQGTGLGLSISYDIVHKHGGTLSVKSQVGKGSTFTIALPIAVNS